MVMRREQGNYPEIKWFFREQWGKGGTPTGKQKMMESAEQMGKVEAFKECLKKEGDDQLFTADFETTDVFQECLTKDLNRWLNDQERPWNRSRKESVETPEPQPDNPLLEEWLRIQAADCARLPLEVLDARQGLEHKADPIRLPDIFVPLKAVAPPEKWLDEGDLAPTRLRALTEGERGEPEAVLDLLARESCAVLDWGSRRWQVGADQSTGMATDNE